jgi:hypothetical protein
MERTKWTDERLDERMTAIDQTFEMIFDRFDSIEAEIRGLRRDFASLQNRLIQVGFALVGVLSAQLVAVVVAVAV